METKKITLAGKEYQLSRLTYTRSRAWREEHGAIVKRLLEALGDIQPLLESGLKLFEDGKDWKDLDLAEIGRVIFSHAGDVVQLLVEGSDLAMNAICAYSVEIAGDRERIEAEAFDEEILGAFWEVVQMAFPLAGSVRKLVSGGQQATATSKNLPLPNGGEASTKSMEKT